MSPSALDTQPRTGSTALARPGQRLHTELRRRRSRRRRMLLAGVAAALVVVLALLGWLVGMSSVFAADQVRVTGQRELSAELVREVAAVPLGVPLARQDLDAIAQRVASLPQVASASVARDWPDTVAVTVTERVPLLAVRRPDGFALVDVQGVAFATRASVPAGVLTTDADPGAVPLLADLAQVAQALPPKVRRDVDRLQASSAADITVLLDGGVTVRWGDASESPLKGEIVAALRTAQTRSIDVSAPHNPATR
jgi:cell division protein FtsQ